MRRAGWVTVAFVVVTLVARGLRRVADACATTVAVDYASDDDDDNGGDDAGDRDGSTARPPGRSHGYVPSEHSVVAGRPGIDR